MVASDRGWQYIFGSIETGERELQFEGIMHVVKEELGSEIYRHS